MFDLVGSQCDSVSTVTEAQAVRAGILISFPCGAYQAFFAMNVMEL